MPARSLNIPAASEEADILSPLSSVLFDPGIGSGRRCRLIPLIRYKMARHVWVIASGVGGGRRLFVFGRRNSLLALLYRLPGFLLRRPVKAKLPVDKPPHNVGPVPKTSLTPNDEPIRFWKQKFQSESRRLSYLMMVKTFRDFERGNKHGHLRVNGLRRDP